ELASTTQIGQAFTADKSAGVGSIQRTRAQAHAAGNLKTTPQQAVHTQTTPSGEQVIVIEPANPQVVYVPTYNPTTVYVQAAPTTVVVQDNSAAIAAGVIGFPSRDPHGRAGQKHHYLQ